MLSQGYAFFEYVDTFVTDVAIQSLNSMEISDKYLVVQRASVGAKPGMPNLPYDQFPEIPRPVMPAGENNTMDALILLMLNMVTPEDLVDDQDIYEDVKEESCRYGAVEDIHIPRPIKKDKMKFASGDTAFQSALDAQRADEAAGVGLVYVKFVNAQDAVCSQGARGTVVCRAVYHCDGAERGQSDDTSPQSDLCPAA